MVIAHGARIIVAAVLIAGCLSFTTQTRGADAQTPDPVIYVPIRWCALKGTKVATDPTALGEPDTDSALLHRLQRASDQVWLPQAGIVFRSAMTVDVVSPAHFPIIDDPILPAAGGGGKEGDIKGFAERDLAAQNCKDEWDAIAPAGVILYGPIGISVREFLDSSGHSSGAPGNSLPSTPVTAAGVDSDCTNPSDVAKVKDGVLAVADPSMLSTGVDDTTLVAHELGHILNLGHGNGMDDPSSVSGPYDEYCDFPESSYIPPNLMDRTIAAAKKVVTDRQRVDARAVAEKIAGAYSDSSDIMNLPVCVLTSAAVKLGELVSVTTSNFKHPGERVELYLGDKSILNGELDVDDSAILEFSLPLDVEPVITPEAEEPPEIPFPYRLLTVILLESALSAHCLLEVVA